MQSQNNNKLKNCLTIAGSDTSGGAGIQADLKVFHAINCFGLSAITCLTAQNTKEIKSLYPVSPEFLAQQLDAIFEDVPVHSVKIGMVLNSEIIHVIEQKLIQYQPLHKFKLVLDPVMVSSSGKQLLEPEALKHFIQKLIPLAHVFTPNRPEASILLNQSIITQNDVEESAKLLCDLGAKSVVIKGGHFENENENENENESNDFLFYPESVTLKKIWFRAPRIVTKNSHGTGCVFSSAISAYLAQGLHLILAVEKAKEFVTNSLKNGVNVLFGQGNGPAFF